MVIKMMEHHMVKFILGTLLIVMSCSTAAASDVLVSKIENIYMSPFKTRILSNQEMIFMGSDKSSSERVDKLRQSNVVFTPWSNIIKQKSSL